MSELQRLEDELQRLLATWRAAGRSYGIIEPWMALETAIARECRAVGAAAGETMGEYGAQRAVRRALRAANEKKEAQ